MADNRVRVPELAGGEYGGAGAPPAFSRSVRGRLETYQKKTVPF